MCTGSLGDVALSLRFIYALAKDNPEDSFVYMLKSNITDLLLDAPDNLEAFNVDFNEGDRSIFALFSLATRLCREDFCGLLDIAPSRRSSFLRRFVACCSRCKTAKVKLSLSREQQKRQKMLGHLPFRLTTAFAKALDRAAKKIGLVINATFPPIHVANETEHKSPFDIDLSSCDKIIGYAPFFRRETPSSEALAAFEANLSSLMEFFPRAGFIVFGSQVLMEKHLPHSPRFAFFSDSDFFYREMQAIAMCDQLLSIDSTFPPIAYALGVPVVLCDETTEFNEIIKQIS